MALSFDCQEAKSNAETLGINWPKSTVSVLRLICTQIKKYMQHKNYSRVKPFLKHL